jgi:uncharacterized membrane protein YkvA (DUF1232 family)
MKDSKHEQHYSEPSFWRKLKHHASEAGLKVVYIGLLLYYALEHPKLPLRAKATIYGALGYFILPLDLIPDWIPAAGFTDDMGALALALIQVSLYIDDSVRNKAKSKLSQWFGRLENHLNELQEVDSKLNRLD